MIGFHQLEMEVNSLFLSLLPDQDVCKLYCFAEGYDFFFALASKVKDGTLCSHDSSNVCIDGLCEVKCSKVYNFLIA